MVRGKWFLAGRDNPVVRAFRRAVFRQRPVPRFPRRVQIQGKSGCNAACWFCPNEETIGEVSHGAMDWDLFTKIVDEVVEHPVKRISPFLMSEPLLDKDLERRIRYIAERKRPETRIRINTNASRLTEDRARSLIESGLDQVHVSFHGITKETYETSMPRMKFEKNLENVLRFLRLTRESGRETPRLKITLLRTSLTAPEMDRIREFWAGHDVPVSIQALTDRSNSSIRDQGRAAATWKPYIKCSELMNQAFILYNGDLVLCCADWSRTHILGNCRERSIESIWNDDPAMTLRRNFIEGNVSGQLCGTCHKAAK